MRAGSWRTAHTFSAAAVTATGSLCEAPAHPLLELGRGASELALKAELHAAQHSTREAAAT